MGNSHWKAAELHDLAAHAHRVAAEHYDKQDHLTAHEQSKLVLEHSRRAHEMSLEAHEKDAPSKP